MAGTLLLALVGSVGYASLGGGTGPATARTSGLSGLDLDDVPVGFSVAEDSEARLFGGACLGENVLQRFPEAQVTRTVFRQDSPPDSIGQVLIRTSSADDLFARLQAAVSSCAAQETVDGNGVAIIATRAQWALSPEQPPLEGDGIWLTRAFQSNIHSSAYNSVKDSTSPAVLLRRGDAVLYLSAGDDISALQTYVEAASD